jgi:hypothetical protein
MNYKLLIVLVSTLFLNACGPTPEDIVSNKAVTERNLSNPEIIGKTYDGQTVKRSIIKYQCKHCDSPSNHFIYFVGNVKSDNYLVQSGKIAYNNVDVTLPEKPTAEDILNKAKEIQEQQGQQKQKDEAEFARLCKELKKLNCDI